MHEAQLLARAFTTYFHLANLCEENYRVSVLHSRENAVDDTQAVDPVNEMTCAYHQLINEMGPARAKELLDQLEFHPVFTAHPTEARRKAVEGKIRPHLPAARSGISCSAARTRRKTPVDSSTRSTRCSAPPDRAEEADSG